MVLNKRIQERRVKGDIEKQIYCEEVKGKYNLKIKQIEEKKYLKEKQRLKKLKEKYLKRVILYFGRAMLLFVLTLKN